MGSGRKLTCLALALLVGACSDNAPSVRRQAEDPVMTEAIEGQLLVDPDLTQKNMRNAVMMPGGPIDPVRPLPETDRKEKR